MNDLIRTDTIFGKRANIVGNISADLVLESLGKVYIKSRNKALTLEEIITSLALGDPNVSTSRVKVLESINSVDVSSYKSGEFLYDKSSKILYLTLDGDAIELISVSPDGQNYVRRTGDTMSGKLIINVKGGPALQVNTADLIKNLNAEYLNGEKATEFTRRNKDERIKGAWTFEKPTSFESETTFYKDIRAYGSIGSPSFSSGYGGYGWRMDATTNTLTVDNLIVRKLMQVYELVVNKISATNGSLWVTNAGKITQVRKLDVYDLSFFNTETNAYQEFLRTTHKGDYFVKLNAPIDFYDLGVDAFLDSLGTVNQIKNCLTPEVLYSARLIKVKTEGILELDFYNDDSDDYNIFLLFDLDFKFNTVFPIVTRNDYQSYKQAIENYDGTGTEPVANISYIYTYYKYFHSHVLDNLYLVSFDPEELPVFKTGDILRCQKWTYSGVKYYDAVVCNVLEMGYIIQVAPSVFDNNTSVVYNKSEEPTEIIQEDSLNSTLYNSSKRHTTSGSERYSAKGIIGQVEEKDSLVLVGNLWDPQRLNAVYITSTDNGAPYIDTLSGMNRPDYSVIYYTPNFKKIKLYQTSGNTNAFVGYEGLVDVPYTGEYYVLKSNSKYDYIYFKYNDLHYLTTNVVLPSEVLNPEVLYISCTPNLNTAMVSSEGSYLLTEDEFSLLTESGQSIILELGEKYKLNIRSTKTTMARFGNLDGIRDEIFPIDKQPYGYGLYGLNVFLTGEFYLNNGKSVADIGYDAIAFAVASEKNIYQSINVLKQDILIALNLLRQNFYNLKLNVYTKNELQTAGMYIGLDDNDRPGIVMWGNKILIATTLDELDGTTRPTALFEDGKIKAKYILVDELHNTYNCDSVYDYTGDEYETDNYFDIWSTVVDYAGDSANSGGYIANSKVKYYENDNGVIYFREFRKRTDESIKKYFQTNSYGQPIYGALLNLNEISEEIVQKGLQIKRWSLYKCGAGDLAGKLSWTADGELSVTTAKIGGFDFSKNGIESVVIYDVLSDLNNRIVGTNTASTVIKRDGRIILDCGDRNGTALSINGGVFILANKTWINNSTLNQDIEFFMYGTLPDHGNIPLRRHGSINLNGPVRLPSIPLSSSNLDYDEVYSDRYGYLRLYNPNVVSESPSETLLSLTFIPVSVATAHDDDSWGGNKFYIRKIIPTSNTYLNALFSSINIYWAVATGVIEFLDLNISGNALEGVNELLALFYAGRLDIKITPIAEMAQYSDDTINGINLYNSYSYTLNNTPNKLMCEVHRKGITVDNIGLKAVVDGAVWRQIGTFLTDLDSNGWQEGTLVKRLINDVNGDSDDDIINSSFQYSLKNNCTKINITNSGYTLNEVSLDNTRVANFLRFWSGSDFNNDWVGFNLTIRRI